MELEPEDEADDSEMEPSLGSFERVLTSPRLGNSAASFAAVTTPSGTKPTPNPCSAASAICISNKNIGRPASGMIANLTVRILASAIRMDWTNRSRSATGKMWGWCDGGNSSRPK